MWADIPMLRITSFSAFSFWRKQKTLKNYYNYHMAKTVQRKIKHRILTLIISWWLSLSLALLWFTLVLISNWRGVPRSLLTCEYSMWYSDIWQSPTGGWGQRDQTLHDILTGLPKYELRLQHMSLPLMKQLDVDVSPPASIISLTLGMLLKWSCSRLLAIILSDILIFF